MAKYCTGIKKGGQGTVAYLLRWDVTTRAWVLHHSTWNKKEKKSSHTISTWVAKTEKRRVVQPPGTLQSHLIQWGKDTQW